MTFRDAPLAMSADQFRRAGHTLVDSIASFLESVHERKVTASNTPAELQQLLDASAALPESGMDADALLEQATHLLFENSLLNGHPKFFGYITSSPAPIGMLGDLLASAVNANVGSWRLGPLATEIEAQTVRWIAELVRYPVSSGGLLVSGGNMANMVGLFAARAAAATWNVREAGVASAHAPRLRIYASAETHTWLHKGADLSGVGTDCIHWIPTDSTQRLDTNALRAAIIADRLAGDLPMMVVGTAGTVSTGAVDPLVEIARICREQNVWFHVDGAYGALAASVPGVPGDLTALGLADSVAVDPHKWLYAPIEAGCVLVRDAERLRNAFAYHPPYYHFGQEALNYVDYGPQNSRGFRALKVWLSLKQVGRSGFVRMIGDDIELRRRLHARLVEHDEFEPLTQGLSIVTFRYVPVDLQHTGVSENAGGAARASSAAHASGTAHAGNGEPATEHYLDRLNEAILESVQREGDLFVSNAIVNGRYALRACIVNFNTTSSDVDAVPELIARVGRSVDASWRSVRQVA